jgi:DNA replication and repair protein RecF
MESYLALAPKKRDESTRVGMQLLTEWRAEDGGKGLAESLIAARSADLARGVTTVGPHRDELQLTINGLPARTQASQGEQRSLALALRLAAHRVLQESAGAPPILLLDDVFSELDDDRSRRLVEQLPHAQAFLTSATSVPLGVSVAHHIHVDEGVVS